MASYQQSIFPWYTVDRKLPSIDEFVPAYIEDEEESSYERYSQFRKEEPDSSLKIILEPYWNTFLSCYFASNIQFSSTDRYSLFIPMNCSPLTEAVSIFESNGKSSMDRALRTEAQSTIENILKNHMVGYKVYASQLEYQDLTIETLGGIIFLDKDGNLNQTDNKIVHYIELERVVLYFISQIL
jgi:hypothetical protein